MRALLVYESMFGNTQEIARAVASGLLARMSVDVVEVGAADPGVPGGIDLLVVGCPTHAFGMSRPQTRVQATEKTDRPLVSAGSGLREWLDTVDRRADRPATAAFDTRAKLPLPGSAARAAARRLRRSGYRIAGPPATFYVAGTTGPLLDGEVERAREWGRRLAAAAAARISPAEPARPASEPHERRSGPAAGT
jgi:hypothetical protein